MITDLTPKTDVYSHDGVSYVQVGIGRYVKHNPILGVTSYLTVEPSGKPGKVNVHVRHEQRVDDTLDLNVYQQNEFRSFKGMDGYQATRIPLVEHRKIMQQCGFQAGHGYDEKKFKQIVNDSDFRKFKIVPGRI